MPNNSSHIAIRSEDVQEILSAVPNWMIRWGNSLVFVLIILILSITWFIKYPDIITSEAMVTTRIPPQKEYARIAGKIDTILIADKQSVKANKPLAIIENTANFKDVFFLKSIIDTVKINKKHFEFPINEIPILFLGDIESAYTLFENNYFQYQLNKQLQPYSGEALANKISKSELNSRLRTLQSQKRLSESELIFQKNDLNRNKILFDSGVISLQKYEASQTLYLQKERGFSNIDASVSQLKEAISNANKTAVGISINKTKEEINLLKNVIQSFKQLKKSIKDWELLYVLISNIDGRVSFLNIWNENQTVNQGDLVFTIIPDQNEEYIAKLKVPALNFGKIKLGQTVNIKLENYPDSEFGMLKGEIKNISLVTDNKGFYIVHVVLPPKLITTYHKEIAFRQEMLGVAEIVTEDLRLIERFFYQLKRVSTILN